MEFFSGPAATSIACFHYKKCSTGNSSSLENLFRFPLLIPLSCVFSFNGQHSVCDACFFWEKCCIFRESVQVRIYSSSLKETFKRFVSWQVFLWQCIADPTSSWNICTIHFWGKRSIMRHFYITFICFSLLKDNSTFSFFYRNEVDKLVSDRILPVSLMLDKQLHWNSADYSF